MRMGYIIYRHTAAAGNKAKLHHWRRIRMSTLQPLQKLALPPTHFVHHADDLKPSHMVLFQ